MAERPDFCRVVAAKSWEQRPSRIRKNETRPAPGRDVSTSIVNGVVKGLVLGEWEVMIGLGPL
jgi:hypothetical protein